MNRTGKARKQRKPRDHYLEMTFERQVRRMPTKEQADLLDWLRHWRRSPERVFWQMDPTGGWRRL